MSKELEDSEETSRLSDDKKYNFCLEKVVVKIIKMSIKATENCVESLMTKGINAASIVVLTPTVTLDTVQLQSPRIDCACQVDTLI